MANAYRSATLCLLVSLLVALPVCAQLAVPALTGHVTDQTGTLTAAQMATLEQYLVAFEARKGSQLAVLVIPSTLPETIDQYALRVAEQWQLGRNKVDDGAVLVVAKNDHAVRLEVGYGLEGALTDITSQRIISDTILPRFRQQDYYGGIDAGVAQIVRVVEGEPLAQPQRSDTGTSQGFRQFVPFLFLVALSIGGAMRSAWGRVPSALATGAVISVLAWFVIGTVMMAALAGVAALLVTLVGIGRVPLVAGGGAGYGGGGFGGGGGGFQGGGGGFGGGGASGRW
ncbi:MAG: TPM domain-containing protein [Candidatus Saccharibacteria bacterium]|nr:TPM domain-containing protein [Rhodoferax sp.]